MNRRGSAADAGMGTAPGTSRDIWKRIENRRDLTSLPDFGKKAEQYRSICIETPRLQRIRRAINELRADARAAGASERFVLPIIGPSNSGKSRALENYLQTVVAAERHASGKLPVVHVKLSSGCSEKELQMTLLGALATDERGQVDERDLKYGTKYLFRERVRKFTKLRSTEVIMVDEAQHLVRGISQESARHAADSIRTCVAEGAAAYVIAGVEEVWQIFRTNDRQLALRCREPIFIRPLDFARADEARQFVGFCAFLDREMAKRGLTQGDSGLAEGETVECLWDVCCGLEGRVSRLVRQSWELAFAIGEPTITRELLSAATDLWAIPLDLARTNPFRGGVRDIRMVRDEWPERGIKAAA